MPPPTRHRSTPPAASAAKLNSIRKGTDFLCKVRYKNPLPDLPFAPKLLPVSPSSGVPSHLCQFFIQPASANEKPLQRPWMKRVPYPLLTDDQLGMPMDLVLVQAQSALTSISEFSTAKEQVEEADWPLLQDLAALRSDGSDNAATTRHRPLVSWLRRTEYMSATEGSRVIGRKKENIDLLRLQKQVQETPDLFDRSRDAQIRAIEKSFDVVNQRKDIADWKHPARPNIHAVSVVPVLPDLDHWPNMYSHVLFDDDPARKPSAIPRSQWTEEQKEKRRVVDTQLSHALLKPLQNPNDETEQFFVYFVPDENVVTGDPEQLEEEHFESIRHYKFHTETEQSLEKLVFVFQNDKVSYTNISARVDVRKKRKKSKHQRLVTSAYRDESSEDDWEVPTDVHLKRRPRTEEELENDAASLESLGLTA